MTYRNYDVTANGRVIARFLRECDAEDFAAMKREEKPQVTYVVQWNELSRTKALI